MSPRGPARNAPAARGVPAMEHVRIRVSVPARDRANACAAVQGVTVSAWISSVILAAAEGAS